MRRPGLLRRGLMRLWTNEVETGETPAYPDVRRLELPVGPTVAYTAALEAARAMPGWRIVDHDRAELRLRAEARTRLLRFVDDVEVWVGSLPDGGSRIHARSASRIGLTDFGTNARRLRAYLARVTERAGGSSGYSER